MNDIFIFSNKLYLYFVTVTTPPAPTTVQTLSNQPEIETLTSTKPLPSNKDAKPAARLILRTMTFYDIANTKVMIEEQDFIEKFMNICCVF